MSGNLVVEVKKMHKVYGDVVRTAPDEVSFAWEDAWHDVFSAWDGHKEFPRNGTFFKAPPGQPDNLITTIDMKASSRMHGVVMTAFTERVLAKQEPTIQMYADLVMNKLMKQAVTPGNVETGATMDLVEWFNWFTFDVAGELTFGEFFGCLSNMKNHLWVSTIFNALKSEVDHHFEECSSTNTNSLRLQ